jgi:hypothetical protein
MKNILRAVLIGALTMACAMPSGLVSAEQATQAGKTFIISRDYDGAKDINAQWNLKRCDATLSTTCVLCDAGSGVVDAVQVSSGAAGSFAVLFDSAVISGISAIGTPAGTRITRATNQPFASPSTTENTGVQTFHKPLPYSNGLVLCNYSADIESHVIYRVLRK